MKKKEKILTDDERDIYWKLYTTLSAEQWAYVCCLLGWPFPLKKLAKMEILDKLFDVKIG